MRYFFHVVFGSEGCFSFHHPRSFMSVSSFFTLFQVRFFSSSLFSDNRGNGHIFTRFWYVKEFFFFFFQRGNVFFGRWIRRF